MSHLLYIYCIVLFVGIAIAFEIYLSHGRLKRYTPIIFIAALIFLLGSFGDTVAHWWNIWGYGTEHTLHYRVLGAEVETILFCIGTGIAVAISALLWADDVDANRSPLERLHPTFKEVNQKETKNRK